jgi:3-hydroxyacyl-CoA dehydrogenase/enoyl-CoA hydratase/3-hydroxybutyryl-CoA epimerase
MAGFRTDNLSVETQGEGGAVLRLDVAGRPVNVFNRQVIADLHAALDFLTTVPSLRLLGIRSGKASGFIAGADLEEFAAVRSADEAVALSAAGQQLMDRLAGLRVSTVALIHGPCLGGGLEFALACDYRLVIDHPKTQLGLPEIELGLIPGWGGTQRLPRVVGVERALQVILGGRRLDAAKARAWGLADLVASQAESGDALRRLGEIALREGKRARGRPPLRTWRQRLLESTPPGRWLIFQGAERVLRRRVPDDMPAPGEALEAVRVGLRQGPEAGLAREREAIGRLAQTPACRNLVQLFFRREQARHATTATALAQCVRRVGVVGAGTMGAGIAQLAAVKGFEVVIQEVSEDLLNQGRQKIADLFRKAVERRLLSEEEARLKAATIKGTTTWEGFGDTDLVIEAVIEDLAAKRSVLQELESRLRPETVVATNTSSLSVARLQEGLRHPERVGGLHFFNPVHKMPLVEVARAPATSDQAAGNLARLAADLGKTPVVVRDSPGLLVNRILIPYLAEAVRLVGEGLAIDRVDRTMRRFGMPVGPLELLDQVGLDVAAHIARAMQPVIGEHVAPGGSFDRLVQRGWLGQKNGLGFYRYIGGKRRVHAEAGDVLREAMSAMVSGRVVGGEWSDEGMPHSPLTTHHSLLTDRMVLVMVNEAASCLAEKLAADAATIDLAMVLGTGWAPHRGGPLRYADNQGIAHIIERQSDLARRFGPRFEPGPELRRRAATGQPFYAAEIRNPKSEIRNNPG